VGKRIQPFLCLVGGGVASNLSVSADDETREIVTREAGGKKEGDVLLGGKKRR